MHNLNKNLNIKNSNIVPYSYHCPPGQRNAPDPKLVTAWMDMKRGIQVEGNCCMYVVNLLVPYYKS